MSPTKQAESIRNAIAGCAGLPVEERVALFNAVVTALAALVADVAPDPALGVQLLPVEDVESNDYNPNKVAATELELLVESIREDGITMPVVTVADVRRGKWIVVDGFHRRKIIAEVLGRRYIPSSIIARTMAERMAATVRHNRARGKHQIELMAALVKRMLDEGCSDHEIAEQLGMSDEELLRLKQVVGAAPWLAGSEYSRSWGVADEE